MQAIFDEAEMSFWTKFFQNEFLRNAYSKIPNTNRSRIWNFLPGLNQTTPRYKKYQQVLKKARNLIEALPQFCTDSDQYDTTAKNLDDLRECAEQVIAKRENDIDKEDTLWNAFKESLPIKPKTTRTNDKQMLEVWREIWDTIVAKRKDLSTSRVMVLSNTLTSSIGYVFMVLISILCGRGFAYALYPHRDPVQLMLCGYFFTVALRWINRRCLLGFANAILGWGVRTLRIFITLIFVYHAFSISFDERNLKPVELALLTAAVVTLYEGLGFYRKVARTIIVCVMFALKYFLVVLFTLTLVQQFKIWYPRQFEAFRDVYPHSHSESYPTTHFMIIMYYITLRFL